MIDNVKVEIVLVALVGIIFDRAMSDLDAVEIKQEKAIDSIKGK